MSFSSEVKKELSAVTPPPCCRRAEAYALFLYGHRFDSAQITLQTESRAAAQTAATLLAAETGVFVEVRTPLSQRSRVCTVAPEPGSNAAILRHFGHAPTDVARRVRFGNLQNPCCAAAFLRGAFLACGTVSDPARSYHLEFAAPTPALADAIALVLEQAAGLHPGTSERSGAHLIYFKGWAEIAGLLMRLGAPRSADAVQQARAQKELRRNANRRTNFDTANIDKTVSAAAAQTEAILRLRRSPQWPLLPDELRALAELRLAHPEYSLRELGEALSPPVSRSGVNHRLARLAALADRAPDTPNSRPESTAGRKE